MNTPHEPHDAPTNTDTDTAAVAADATVPIDENPTGLLPDAKDGDTVGSAAAPTRRRAVWASAIAVTALLAVAVGGYFAIQGIQRADALSAFGDAVADREAAYAAQDDAITALTDLEIQAITDYSSLRTIATTLTDSTVENPETRQAVLASAAELAETAWIELDESNVPLEEQAPAMDAIIPRVPLAGPKPAEDVDGLATQTAELRDDADAIGTYTDLITEVSDNIATDLTSGRTAVDVALESAATKGQALVYDRAPAETAEVVAAAAALITDDAAELPLEDKANLVTIYLVAVRAAWTQQEAVLAAEKAEADRAAAEQQRQNQSNNQNNNGSRNNNNNNGSWNGGSKPGNGGTTPGGGTNPGNGGTTPGNGGSNWQPLKLQYAGACDGVGGKQEASYGSWLTLPASGVGSSSQYEIPGVGWGITWKCKHW